MIIKKSLALIAGLLVCAGSTLAFSSATAAEQGRSSGKEPPPGLARLVDEQLERGRSNAIRGSLKKGNSLEARNGWVVVQLVPAQSQLESLEVGDSYTTPIIGAAKVTNGTFQVKLDSKNDVLGDGVNDVEVSFIEAESGELAAMGAGQLQLNRRGKSRNFEVVSIDLNLDGGSDIEGSVAEEADLDHIMNVPEGEMEPGSVDEYSCFNTVVGRYAVPYTALVVGTNTSAYEVSAGVGAGASATTGWGFKAEGKGWVEASGSKTVTNSSGNEIAWGASNAYGTYSYRPVLNVHQIDHWCYDGWNNHRKLVPVGFTGGRNARAKWGNTAYPTWCTDTHGRGEFRKTWSTSTNWSGGLKLSWTGVVSFNTDARSGYTSNAWVKLEQTSNDRRYLCGRNDWPGGSPGYIMADWKDR